MFLFYLNAFFIIDSPNHFHTHFCNFGKSWLLNADIPKYFYDSFSDTDTSILWRENNYTLKNKSETLVYVLYMN